VAIASTSEGRLLVSATVAAPRLIACRAQHERRLARSADADHGVLLADIRPDDGRRAQVGVIFGPLDGPEHGPLPAGDQPQHRLGRNAEGRRALGGI